MSKTYVDYKPTQKHELFFEIPPELLKNLGWKMVMI